MENEKLLTKPELIIFETPVETLTTNKHIDKIVDPTIRRLILKRIEQLGGFNKGKNIPDGTFYQIDEQGIIQPQIFLPNKNGAPVPIKKVRIRGSYWWCRKD